MEMEEWPYKQSSSELQRDMSNESRRDMRQYTEHDDDWQRISTEESGNNKFILGAKLKRTGGKEARRFDNTTG